MKISQFIPVLALAVGLPAISRAEVTDGVQAVVNDHAITFAEVEEYTRPAVDALRRQYALQPELFDQKLKQALKDSLEQLVERQLILHSFESEGYRLPESVVDQMVQEKIRERFYGDRVTLMKTLQAQGITFDEFRKQIREQYIETALRNQNVQREIIISPYKVESYYNGHLDQFKLEDQARLRTIFFAKASPEDTNPVALAREVRAKIKAGAAFAEMAALYSQGSQQKQGGDWGWVERSVPRKEIADAAFALAPGEVSDVLDLSDGCYLVMVEDKRPAHAKPLTEVRGEIEKTLRIQEQARLQKQWMDSLKRKTFVRYF